ncbi:MAG: alpha-mannosidase, partial [Anaerolineae bacterium]|nr:alpha-mannosidase [Anaerolineae bacterium]
MHHHDSRMTAAKIAQRIALIEPLAYRARVALSPLRLLVLPDGHTPPPAVAPAEAVAVPEGAVWGGRDVQFALYGSFSVPPEFEADAPCELVLGIGDSGDFSHPEALVYLDGVPYAAVDRHHPALTLPAHLRDGREHSVMLHGWTGLLGAGKPLVMRASAVGLVDSQVRRLLAWARTALQAANLLDDNQPAKARLLNALDAAFKRLNTREPLGADFYASLPEALDILTEGVRRAAPALDVEVVAAGHAHIDVAWLWTLGQTRRKAAQTFHTVLRQMEDFPAYHFTQSQPHLYEVVRQDHPALFEAIKAQVQAGRWEPIGGMWVEADCNITGGESLARQLMLGRAFFREQFGAGAESPVLWLPDVFGYAWNLPQLIKLAGLEYFFTIKIGWNQVNKLPYDSFWWQGLDGTKVLTHFSTTPDHPWTGEATPADLMRSATYNAGLNAFAALGSWAKLKHKDVQRVMLMSYGYGDGGGGPTREMNENAQVLADFPAVPRVRQGRVIDFFRQLERESGAHLPTWNAELYLEIHRGTYTTQSRNKRANRQAEFLLHDAEFLAAVASLADPTYAYPHAVLREAWKTVCLNQFHDIIPGSSIGAVYTESLAQYAEVRQQTEAVREAALRVVVAQVGGAWVLVNPTGFERTDVVFVPHALPALVREGQPVLAQPTEGGVWLDAGALPPYSVIPLSLAASGYPLPPTGLVASPTALENRYIRLTLNDAGDIVRIYDKVAERDILPAGAVANQWQMFEDRPLNWDAWDIDIFYDDTCVLAEPAESVRVVEAGPLRATLEIRRRIGQSAYVQRISLSHTRRQIDFETEMDWQERHMLLKVAFPVEVLSPVASYEVQWGHVQRPTHRNTSWDWARFETCAQKWVDLSEGNYGVALLNDCK